MRFLSKFYSRDIARRPVVLSDHPFPHLWDVLYAVREAAEVIEIRNSDSPCQVRLVEPKKVRSRDPVKRSNLRMTGKFPSRKMMRSPQWESKIEKQAFRILEVHPAVKLFHEQPIKITWMEDGAKRQHFPDIHVELSNSARLLIEIKEDEVAVSKEITARTTFLTTELRKLDIHYLLIAESQVTGVYQANARKIIKLAAREVDQYHEEAIRIQLRTPQRLANLESDLGPSIKPLAFELIRRGRILFDASQPLTGATELTWQEGK